ncbi:MAG: hypothetical protein HFI67_01275 [Lachnospiraceae bacterium]|nr:hypothetical protein [Lachnospiraceae bacterium]
MAFKIIGAVCIIISTTAIGFGQSFRLHLRYGEILELKKILCLFSGEIRFGGGTLGETFEKMAGRSKAPFQKFFLFLTEEMQKKEGERLMDIWSRAVEEQLKEAHLTEADREILLRLGNELGCLDRETQLHTISLAAEQVEDVRQELHGELPKKMRLYNCLGILAGVFITILLI